MPSLISFCTDGREAIVYIPTFDPEWDESPVKINPFLECGDLSPLWSAATRRSLGSVEFIYDLSVKPPENKSGDGSPHSK